jgi:hypothetical protein
MQQLFVTYYQRVMLWNMIGSHTVPTLDAAATFLRLLEKIRLSDQEVTESQMVMEAGNFTWKQPSQGYGDRLLDLENQEAEALAALIREVKGVRIQDALWLSGIVSRFYREPAEAKAKSDGGISA